MSTLLEGDVTQQFNKDEFQEKLPQHYRTILNDFQKTSRSFVQFNLLFLFLASIELIAFAITFVTDSMLLPFLIGALFLTSFTYFTLLFYYQAKKPEQMKHLLDRFLTSCRLSLGIPQGTTLHHLSMAETLTKLTNYLTDYEWGLVKSPNLFTGFFSRFSAFCYWHDVFRFKQLLLYAAVEEHLNQVRETPTDLEVHASLANVYVLLSQLYKEPKAENHPRLKSYQKQATIFQERFKTSASLAIQEFQILSQYAPNDPWVHEQLATGYRELDMHLEEIKEVEILLSLRPQDKEILYRLGTLYFEQGQNGKGLQVFEELKKANFKKAEDLILSYGRTTKSEHHLTPVEV